MALKPFIIGILLTGLFAFAIINGGILLSINNNGNQSIGDDPSISGYNADLETQLSQADTQSNASLNALGQSPISFLSGNVIFDAIGGIWKTITVIPVAVYNLTIGLLVSKILDSGTFGIVTGVLASIMFIIIIFGVWKWASTGDGEN